MGRAVDFDSDEFRNVSKSGSSRKLLKLLKTLSEQDLEILGRSIFAAPFCEFASNGEPNDIGPEQIKIRRDVIQILDCGDMFVFEILCRTFVDG